jgi:hypothetical protein
VAAGKLPTAAIRTTAMPFSVVKARTPSARGLGSRPGPVPDLLTKSAIFDEHHRRGADGESGSGS